MNPYSTAHGDPSHPGLGILLHLIYGPVYGRIRTRIRTYTELCLVTSPVLDWTGRPRRMGKFKDLQLCLGSSLLTLSRIRYPGTTVGAGLRTQTRDARL